MYRIREVFAIGCCSFGLLLELGCGAGITQSVTNQLSIEPQPSQLLLRQTVQLHATLSYSDGTSADVTSSAAWSTAASSIASVSSRGLLSCAAAGSTKVIATINGVTKSSALNCSTAQLILSGIGS